MLDDVAIAQLDIEQRRRPELQSFRVKRPRIKVPPPALPAVQWWACSRGTTSYSTWSWTKQWSTCGVRRRGSRERGVRGRGGGSNSKCGVRRQACSHGSAPHAARPPPTHTTSCSTACITCLCSPPPSSPPRSRGPHARDRHDTAAGPDRRPRHERDAGGPHVWNRGDRQPLCARNGGLTQRPARRCTPRAACCSLLLCPCAFAPTVPSFPAHPRLSLQLLPPPLRATALPPCTCCCPSHPHCSPGTPLPALPAPAPVIQVPTGSGRGRAR